jgi:hypothetical protein
MLAAWAASASSFCDLREKSAEDQVISVAERISDRSRNDANPLNLNGFNLFRSSQPALQPRRVLPLERLGDDQASDESPLSRAHRYRGARWRQSIPFFSRLNAYPTVLRLDSIAVDVEFLPLITRVFCEDDVDPAIEIQIPAHRGAAADCVCQFQQKRAVCESFAASISWRF